MAAPIVMYEFCALCRHNHSQKVRHVYSKSHAASVKRALFKLSSKVTEARKLLATPEVKELDWEDGATFWCYFCASEYERHTKMDICTIRDGGLLKHVSTEDHRKKMHTFWFENHVKKKKKLEKYCITEDEEKMFRVAALSAIKEFERKVEQDRKKEANRIKRLSDLRHHLVTFHQNRSAMTSSSIPEAAYHQHHDATSSTAFRRVRTIAARAEGLTHVNFPAEDSASEKLGNVHTGALPPWLQEDASDDQHHVIGPTRDDLQKHLALETKRKLPPNRVGAKFNHKQVTGQTWMPSFGRVWNQNRRTNSKQQFMREQRQSNTLPVAIPTTPVPYKRKSATVTSISDPPSSSSSSSSFDTIAPSQRRIPELHADITVRSTVRNGSFHTSSFQSLPGDDLCHQNNIQYSNASSTYTSHMSQSLGRSDPSPAHQGWTDSRQNLKEPWPRGQPGHSVGYPHSHIGNSAQHQDDRDIRPWLYNLADNQNTPGYGADSSEIRPSLPGYHGYKRQKKSHEVETDFRTYSKRTHSVSPEERIQLADSLL